MIPDIEASLEGYGLRCDTVLASEHVAELIRDDVPLIITAEAVHDPTGITTRTADKPGLPQARVTVKLNGVTIGWQVRVLMVDE